MRSLFNLLNYGSRRVRYRFFGGMETRFLGQTRRVNSKFTGSLDFKRIGAVTSLGFLMVYTVSDHKEQKEILKNAKQVSIEEAKRILELDGLNLNERHEMGWTCLHVQVANHNISAVKFLLTLGADPNISYEFRNTGNGSVDEKPPHEMLCQDNKLCKSLVKVINFKGFTSLHFAVLIGNLEMVTILLEAGADPSKKSEQGFTPSCLTNDPKILKLLEKYHTINEEEDKENNNADQKRIIEKVSDSKEAGNELEHEIHESDDQNEDQMQEQSLEDPVLKNETMDIQSEQFKEKENDFPSQDTQTSDELNMISLQEQGTTEWDKVQKQKINGEEVAQEPEDQKQKVDYCERAESSKIETVNEPYEGGKMEPVSGEITKDVLRQEMKQEHKANETQVHAFTEEQGNLLSRKHDGEVKTESTNEETFSDRSVELVEIVEDQKSKSNELDGVETFSIQSEEIQENRNVITYVEMAIELSSDGVETFSIQSEEIQENRNVITYVEMAIELSSDQKTETKDAKEEDILEGMFGNAEEVRNLKVLQDTQTSNELNVILVQEKRTTELDDVQKQRINDEVTQEPEDQRQKVDNCEQAQTPKMKTVNEPSEEEKMEPLSGEIIKDVLRQDVKQVQKANESQVHDCTDEQRNLVSRKHDDAVKTELANDETFSDKSDVIKCEQVEIEDEEASVKLVEIVEEQKSESNELDGIEILSIQSEEIQENGNVITDVEGTIALSPEQKMETIELEVKEEEILEGLTFENGIQSLEHTLNIVEKAQLFDELKVILVQDQRTSDLGKVQLLINDKDVTQESQKQKAINCEQAETPKMETVNETVLCHYYQSDGEKMEPLHEEITEIKGDVPSQEVKQEQKAKESQVHDITDEQGNLLSGKPDGEVKTESTIEEIFSDKSDAIKCDQVEKQGEEASIKLVEIFEEQIPKLNELNVSEEELIFDGKPKVNEVEQENGGEINHELESIANIDVTMETEIFDVISKVDKLEAGPIKQELNTDCHEEAIKIQMEDVLKIEPVDDLTPEVQSSTSLIVANFLIWASVAIIRSLT